MPVDIRLHGIGALSDMRLSGIECKVDIRYADIYQAAHDPHETLALGVQNGPCLLIIGATQQALLLPHSRHEV